MIDNNNIDKYISTFDFDVVHSLLTGTATAQSFFNRYTLITLQIMTLRARHFIIVAWLHNWCSARQKRDKAQVLLNKVFDHLDINERRYFGLQFVDSVSPEENVGIDVVSIVLLLLLLLLLLIITIINYYY